MKKQFFRVKQLADQTFLKADKSDVLNHKELQVADHKVEYLRGALTSISKRIPSGQGLDGAIEKRMKKYPEFALYQVLNELSKNGVNSECKLLQEVFRECGQIEYDLARDQAEHDVKVEQLVGVPVQRVVEHDLPNIAKQKKSLSKYILDKDSASNRYNASKNGNNKEALKDDLEEADIKVEQHRDALASEMFSLLRRESELSQYMLQYLKLQRAYHESALKNLEKMIPSLEQYIGDSDVKAMFEIDLNEHLRVTNRKIAFPLELCVLTLTELGMSEEGLFRVAGGAARVKRLKLAIDSGCFTLPLLPEYRDVHVLASTLKCYLRELPEPLLTFRLYNEWMEAMRYPEDQRMRAVQDVLRKLPSPNRDNLTYLVQFLAKLSRTPANKMTSSNIAIVIAPNLLWHRNPEVNMHMTNCTTLNMIAELFVNHADLLFPDDVSAYITLTIDDLLHEEEEFQRPNLTNVKLLNHDEQPQSFHNSTETLENASPKPQTRRKNKLAPTPPVGGATHKTDGTDYVSEHINIPSSYPSGSTTLTRAHKSKTERKPIVADDDTAIASSPKRQSLVLDDDAPKAQISAHAAHVDHLSITLNHVSTKAVEKNKPVAAPRCSLDAKPPMDAMSKSMSAIDVDGDVVHMRRPVPTHEISERPAKPVIPARPASLKATPRLNLEEPAQPHKTQCSVYSVAHKQQPSFVQIQTRSSNNNASEKFLAGHDMQMAEKERFLGHHGQADCIAAAAVGQMVENERDATDFNCNVAGESVRKRTASLGDGDAQAVEAKSDNERVERVNGNVKSSHTRTHSDGNLIESGFAQPLSPRSLSKPTQPPPPPPPPLSRKPDDSTDL